MSQKSIWSLLDEQSHENRWLLTDAQAAAVVPIICYWILSGFYEFCSYFNIFSQHYIYEDEDGKKKNLVGRGRVITVVLAMQAVQISFALYMIRFNTENVTGEGGFGTLSYFSDLPSSMELVSPSNAQAAA
ncbi:hypothetical protein VE03_04347 [Pseudogymnoascus sp. 23342-1-I1]|nr:hypothetical protein VE03_04347 [Pseudogymnoascus sp. 23342-1-I1]